MIGLLIGEVGLLIGVIITNFTLLNVIKSHERLHLRVTVMEIERLTISMAQEPAAS